MGAGLRIGLLFVAACTLQARTETVYTVHIPAAGPATEPALHLGSIPPGGVSFASGEWDITVVLDPVKCQLYCAYQRKRDPFGRVPLTSLLPPPAVTVAVFSRTVTIDPGRFRFPAVTAATAAVHERVYLSSRKFLADAPAPNYVAVLINQTPSLRTHNTPASAFPVIAPLRI